MAPPTKKARTAAKGKVSIATTTGVKKQTKGKQPVQKKPAAPPADVSDEDAGGDEDDDLDLDENEDASDEEEDGAQIGGLDDLSNSDEDSFDDDDDELDFDNSDDEEGLQQQQNNKRKRADDPDAFATAMSKILSSHLKAHTRSAPILARNKTSAATLESAKLEAKARRALALERRALLDKNHVVDILPRDEASARGVLEYEKALRKVAQRGVVKLFNAVRVSQVKADEARDEGMRRGVVGVDKRTQKVAEMSKTSFLDLIKKG
ncbi:pre-60S ribosomal particles component [Saitoella coloradoensis]